MKSLPRTAEHWVDSYDSHPFTGVESNIPYAVGDDTNAAAERRAIQAQFLRGEIDNPEVSYPLLNRDELMAAEARLWQLLEQTQTLDEPEAVQVELYAKAAEKLAELYRHLQIIRGIGATSARRPAEMQRAGDMTLEIFGQPQPEIFNALLAPVHELMHRPWSPASPAAQLSTELGRLVGQPAGEIADLNQYQLRAEAAAVLREDLFAILPAVRDTLLDDEDDAQIAPGAAVHEFRALLRALGMEGWDSTLTGGKAAGTSGRTRRVTIGRERQPFTPRSLNGVRAHEDVGHAWRSYNMRRQANPARRTKLRGDLLFNEGFAVGIEQIITGARRLGGKRYYLSLGLQLGLDRANQPRDFRETYEVLWRTAALGHAKDGGEIDPRTIETAQEKAYQECLRTRRGGALDARDISYLVGAMKVNQWLNTVAELPEAERREQLKEVLSWLFDPTNPDHIAYRKATEESVQ